MISSSSLATYQRITFGINHEMTSRSRSKPSATYSPSTFRTPLYIRLLAITKAHQSTAFPRSLLRASTPTNGLETRWLHLGKDGCQTRHWLRSGKVRLGFAQRVAKAVNRCTSRPGSIGSESCFNSCLTYSDHGSRQCMHKSQQCGACHSRSPVQHKSSATAEKY